MNSSNENHVWSLRKSFESLLIKSPETALLLLLLSHLQFAVVLIASVSAFPRFEVPFVYTVLFLWCAWMFYLGVLTFSYFFENAVFKWTKISNGSNRDEEEYFVSKRCSFLFLIVLSTASPLIVRAEVRNAEGLFESSWTCESYLNFLENKETETTVGCDELSVFLIQNEELGNRSYLRKLSKEVSLNSALGSLVATLWEKLDEEALNVFLASEIAQRHFVFSMAANADMERAELYSELLFRLHREAAIKLCGETKRCRDFPNVALLSDLLGSSAEHLKQFHPEKTLLCLIRTDAFSVPIRSVLVSDRFSKCIET